MPLATAAARAGIPGEEAGVAGPIRPADVAAPVPIDAAGRTGAGQHVAPRQPPPPATSDASQAAQKVVVLVDDGRSLNLQASTDVPTGAILGVVLDQTGGSMPGATLVLNDGRGATRTTISDVNGRFALRNLSPGTYELAAGAAGFATLVHALTIEPGESATSAFTLPVGTLEEQLIVSCAMAAAAIDAVVPSAPTEEARRRSMGFFARMQQAVGRATGAFMPVLSAQQTTRSLPVRVGGNLQPPRKLSDVRPPCLGEPIPASGVVVRLVGRIDVEGRVKEMRGLAVDGVEAEAGIPILITALEAVRQWTFTPTALNGVPVEVTLSVHINYRPS
jgi:hypothetical protein